MWKVEIYEDKAGEWRWRLKSSNGSIVASSNEHFYSESNAKRAAENMMRHAGSAEIVTVPDASKLFNALIRAGLRRRTTTV